MKFTIGTLVKSYFILLRNTNFQKFPSWAHNICLLTWIPILIGFQIKNSCNHCNKLQKFKYFFDLIIHDYNTHLEVINHKWHKYLVVYLHIVGHTFIITKTIRWPYCLIIFGFNFCFDDLLNTTFISYNELIYKYLSIYVILIGIMMTSSISTDSREMLFFLIPCFWKNGTTHQSHTLQAEYAWFYLTKIC